MGRRAAVSGRLGEKVAHNVSQADLSPDACVGYRYPFPSGVRCRLGFQTRLRLFEEHRKLISVMFWALYSETSNDRYYSGAEKDGEIVNPETGSFDSLSVALARSFFIEGQAGVSYCTDGINGASDEPPNVTGAPFPAWSVNITRLEHCLNHRYMMAQLFLNGLLHYSRSNPAGIDLSDPDQFMGYVYRFFYTNYRVTMGEEVFRNRVFSDRQCQPQVTAIAENGAIKTYRTYYRIIEHMNERIKTSSANFPPRIRLDIAAVKWLDDYLTCKLAQPNPNSFTERVKYSYQRSILPQIEKAILDFYNGVPDPTDGAFEYKSANNAEKTYSVCVGGCIAGTQIIRWDNPILDAAYIQTYYNTTLDQNMSCDTFHLFTEHMDQIRRCYRNGEGQGSPRVLQPILWLDTGPDGVAGYIWISLVYQQSQTKINR